MWANGSLTPDSDRIADWLVRQLSAMNGSRDAQISVRNRTAGLTNNSLIVSFVGRKIKSGGANEEYWLRDGRRPETGLQAT